MPDDDRTVELSDELDILPDNTADDTDTGWGEPRSRRARRRLDEQRLLDERPPHWDLYISSHLKGFAGNFGHMSDPSYRYGQASPRRPEDPTQRMPPVQDPPGSPRPQPRINPGRLWAGGLGAAVVVALVVLVGILLVRGVLDIPVLAAQGEGAYGTASTTTYAITAGGLALVATGLLHILLLAMPRPMQFFYWICALVTAVAVLLPFTLVAELDAQVATAGINLVAGICLMSVLGSIGASSVNYDRESRY